MGGGAAASGESERASAPRSHARISALAMAPPFGQQRCTRSTADAVAAPRCAQRAQRAAPWLDRQRTQGRPIPRGRSMQAKHREAQRSAAPASQGLPLCEGFRHLLPQKDKACGDGSSDRAWFDFRPYGLCGLSPVDRMGCTGAYEAMDGPPLAPAPARWQAKTRPPSSAHMMVLHS